MSENIESTHIAVIGAGPGGYAAAFLAADFGLGVTIIDPAENPGGVCLHRGCIPSKTLLHAAKVINEADEASNWGIDFKKPKIDVDKLRTWKDDVVQKLTGGLGKLTDQRKIRRIRGHARFLDASTIEIHKHEGGKQKLYFGHAILAAGSSPTQLPHLDLSQERIMDSSDALALPDVPDSLLVVGAGYIGMELGTAYAAFGSEVTVIEKLPEILPATDRDLAKVLERRARQTFKEILTDTEITKAETGSDKVEVTLKDKDGNTHKRVFDKVLVAVGRQPNTADLGLENTRIELDGNGFVKINAQRQTAEPKIYAIGDIAGPPLLAHKASHEGRVAVEAITGQPTAFDPQAIPAVVYTDPELAYCGLSEHEAKENDRSIKVAKFPWGASGRALTLGRDDGLTKMIIDPDTDRLLGAGIVGAGAGELISENVLAIEMAALAADLQLSIHPPPTLSETVMESASAYFGQSTHIYRPRNA